MKNYINPTVELLMIESNDVIRTSPSDPYGDDIYGEDA